MESQYITRMTPTTNNCADLSKIHQEREISFQSILDADSITNSDHEQIVNPSFTLIPHNFPLETAFNTSSKTEAIAAYQKQANQSNQTSGWQKYKDDQLLSNPGGDHYYLGRKEVVSKPKDQESFWGRIKKDLSDCFSNVKNFFKNLFSGAKKLYRDENNQIQETKQRGLLGSVVDFFKDLGSALSFGTWRPDGEKAPQGFFKRIGFFFSKMKEAIFGDLVQGVAGSVIHMGEDLVLAGWNLVEVIPDATIGNFEDGRKLTTTIFDNGQVVIDYLTDILPTGEAWLRVHASKLCSLKDPKPPIFYNINMPEHYTGDARWRYVRNTPFRKTIETIGSLLADIVTIKLFGDARGSSEERHERN
ncbi:MAG: hypothetical protein JRI94_04825 [Deltaproteobacteria bacterium]|nr:hypothetical protein [Deltaproteobacteria bacterium]